MLHRVLVSALCLFATLRCFAQPSSPPQYPDYVLFRYFFIHLDRLQRAADSLKAKGKRDSSMRTVIKRKAKLSDKEYSNLIFVASSCNAAYAQESQSGIVQATQLGQEYSIVPSKDAASPPALPAAVIQQLKQLEARRQRVITNCVASLQAQMAPGSFNALHAYVAAAEGPRIKWSAPRYSQK